MHSMMPTQPYDILGKAKLGKLKISMVASHQGYILSPCLFNLHAEYIMQNARQMKHKLESRLPGEISITLDMQMTPPLRQKGKRKVMKVNEESEKAVLKLSIQKLRSWHPVLSLHGK